MAGLARVAQSESADGFARSYLELVATSILIRVLRLTVSLQGAVEVDARHAHALLEVGQLAMQRDEVAARCHHFTEQRVRYRLGSVLWKVADANAAGSVHESGGRLADAGDEVEQRGLAGSVGAYDGETLARLDTQLDRREHDVGAVCERHFGAVHERHRAVSRGRWREPCRRAFPAPTAPARATSPVPGTGRSPPPICRRNCTKDRSAGRRRRKRD